MSWQDIIKEDKQGPLPEYAMVGENHPAWKKHQKEEDKIKSEIINSLRFMRSIGKIADDIKVSPQNQKHLDNLLKEFAHILDLMASLSEPQSSDYSGHLSAQTAGGHSEMNSNLRRFAQEYRDAGKKLRKE